MAGLTTGGGTTPLSGAAHVNVPVGSARQGQHPYASGGYDPGFRGANGDASDDAAYGSAAYGRASPMIASAAPPAVSNVRAHAHGDIGQDGDMPRPQGSLWKILTCRCG
jgi:casein kinase 1